jgi:hypothetical protein
MSKRSLFLSVALVMCLPGYGYAEELPARIELNNKSR